MDKVVIENINLNWFQKKRIKRKIYKNLKNHPLCEGNIKSTYHIDVHLHNSSEFKCLKNKIVETSFKVFKRDFFVTAMWANVGSHGSKVVKHNHIIDEISGYPCDEYFKIFGVSGVFYLNKPELSGNIIFDDHVLEVEEGDLLFFSPYMNHSTEINKSKNDRVVVSFNGFFT